MNSFVHIIIDWVAPQLHIFILCSPTVVSERQQRQIFQVISGWDLYLSVVDSKIAKHVCFTNHWRLSSLKIKNLYYNGKYIIMDDEEC